MNKAKVLIPHASGTNRDHEAAEAVTKAGGIAEIAHISTLTNSAKLNDYQMIIFPGGFSYGDALGAGKRLALDIELNLADALSDFVAAKKPIIGICNGFQALVKSGLLPGEGSSTQATLSHNQNSTFECRWVWLEPNKNSVSPIIQQLKEPIYCPAAHGEGRFLTDAKFENNLVALNYADENGNLANGDYPLNPNASQNDIAGISNKTGNILGFMPHPEDHIHNWQHPRWTRQEQGNSGLKIFEAAINYSQQIN